MRRKHSFVLAAAMIAASPVVVSAAVFPETEPNDTKATANLVSPLLAGDTIVGNSTSAAGVGLDYFDVRTAPLALGIYQHRLTITSAIAGHTGTIRGVTVTAAPADTLAGIPWDGVFGTRTTTESAVQTSSSATVPPRFNQWYGFGKGERFTYRVTGAAATTADYTATMTTTPVVPTPVPGLFLPGLITFSTFGQGHSTDTEMWVYDSGFNAIPGYGNDDESPLGGSPGTGATGQSWLARTYAPGTYYVALSNFPFRNDQPSPSDDDFRTSAVMEFPDIVLNDSTSTALNMQFTLSDGTTSSIVPNTKVGPYDVNWFVFTVVPEPTTLGLLAMALPLIARRRRS